MLYRQKRYYQKTYKLTEKQLKQILKLQNFRCAICKNEFTKDRVPLVDHCHTYNFVRGLLCIKCNALLGFTGDDIVILENAITYLNRAIQGIWNKTATHSVPFFKTLHRVGNSKRKS